MSRIIARIAVFERHPDGSSRTYTVTRTIEDTAPIKELFDWRRGRIHDPVNGEFASHEIIISPDDMEHP